MYCFISNGYSWDIGKRGEVFPVPSDVIGKISLELLPNHVDPLAVTLPRSSWQADHFQLSSSLQGGS